MSDQYILSITIVSLLGLFIWGKFRYDALASGALVTLIILGVIPSNQHLTALPILPLLPLHWY